MKIWNRIAALAVCAAILSGCAMLNGGDDLLQPPKPPKDYVLLQNKLNELENSMSPISPQSGQYRNTVTFEDLNGDGIDEAIATMCSKKSGKVQVYIFQQNEEEYVQIGRISGQGSAIGSLSFPYLGANHTEKGMIITWNLSNNMEKGMTVCALRNGEMRSLRELEYTDFTTYDLDGDKADELFTVHYTETGKTASLYDYNAKRGTLELIAQADATQDIQSPVNITTGMLASGENAVFVDNKYENETGMQTDIYVLEKKKQQNTVEQRLQNLALTAEPSTYRSVALYYSDDIDMDGCVEVPQLKEIPTRSDTEAASTDGALSSSWYVDWYQYSLDGGKTAIRTDTTYSSLNEEWRFSLPPGWCDHVSVKTGSNLGISQTLFVDAETDEVLLTIYVFGERDRNLLSQTDQLIDLGGANSRCYAMCVEAASSDYAISSKEAERRFTRVHPDWH